MAEALIIAARDRDEAAREDAAEPGREAGPWEANRIWIERPGARGARSSPTGAWWSTVTKPPARTPPNIGPRGAPAERVYRMRLKVTQEEP